MCYKFNLLIHQAAISPHRHAATAQIPHKCFRFLPGSFLHDLHHRHLLFSHIDSGPDTSTMPGPRPVSPFVWRGISFIQQHPGVAEYFLHCRCSKGSCRNPGLIATVYRREQHRVRMFTKPGNIQPVIQHCGSATGKHLINPGGGRYCLRV